MFVLFRSLGALALLVFSGSAFATCPVQPCQLTGTASTIAGSNADRTLMDLTVQMASDSTEVARAIADSTNAQMSSMSSGTQGIISTMMEMNQAAMDSKIKGDKAMLDADMAYQAELAELEYRAQISVFGKNDTKEEINLIIETLEDHTDLTVPEIIYMLKTTIDDDPEGKIPVPIASAESICSKEDIEEKGLCSKVIKIYPSTKLEKAFKSCSAGKRLLILQEQEAVLQHAVITQSNIKTAKALKSTDSAGAASARIASVRELTCSPVKYQNGVCRKDLTPEEFQEKMIIGAIIPNGDVMASNFSTPTAMAAEGYIDDLGDETYKAIINQSLDRRRLDEQPNQKVIPLFYTYRNANQVKASMAFIDNIVGEDLIPNQSALNRRKSQNAEYQAYFLSRIASLNMVRVSLSNSMSMRVGTNMSKLIEDGSINGNFDIQTDSDAGKEDVLGAGPLDLLKNRIDRQFGNLQMSDQNSNSGNSSGSFVDNASGSDALVMQAESLRLQNELMWKSYLITEQTLSLDAITLAQKINSPEVIEYMKSLRKGR
jgi:hypothetical protein